MCLKLGAPIKSQSEVADNYVYIYFTFSALNCGDPPLVMNAVFDPNTNISYGSSVDYTCIPGYMFTRDVTSNRIHCDDSGQWTHISDCISKLPKHTSPTMIGNAII